MRTWLLTGCYIALFFSVLLYLEVCLAYELQPQIGGSVAQVWHTHAQEYFQLWGASTVYRVSGMKVQQGEMVIIRYQQGSRVNTVTTLECMSICP